MRGMRLDGACMRAPVGCMCRGASPSALDLVVIATPNRAHVPLAITALEAGLPVVVDKPVAPSAADAERLIAAARAQGHLLSAFQNRRWDSDFLTARRLIQTGAL